MIVVELFVHAARIVVADPAFATVVAVVLLLLLVVLVLLRLAARP